MSPMSVEQHYGGRGLVDAIRAGRHKAGKDPERLTPVDLAPIDEFHILNLEENRIATIEAVCRKAAS